MPEPAAVSPTGVVALKLRRYDDGGLL